MNVENTMIWFCVLSWSFIIKCSVSINPDRSAPSNNCQINRLWKYPAEFSGSLVGTMMSLYLVHISCHFDFVIQSS